MLPARFANTFIRLRLLFVSTRRAGDEGLRAIGDRPEPCFPKLRMRLRCPGGAFRNEAGIAAGVELAHEVAEPVLEGETAPVRLPVVDHEHA